MIFESIPIGILNFTGQADLAKNKGTIREWKSWFTISILSTSGSPRNPKIKNRADWILSTVAVAGIFGSIKIYFRINF